MEALFSTTEAKLQKDIDAAQSLRKLTEESKHGSQLQKESYGKEARLRREIGHAKRVFAGFGTVADRPHFPE